MTWIDHLQRCYDGFEDTQLYRVGYLSVEKVFTQFPATNAINALARIGVLDSLYVTKLDDTKKTNLLRILIDDGLNEEINNGEVEAVKIIRQVTQGPQGLYVFATKYCHFSNPTAFPIYDNLVAELIMKLSCMELEPPFPVHNLTRDHLREYTNFKNSISEIRQLLNWINDNSYDKVDKALWFYMKNRLMSNVILGEIRDTLNAEANELGLPQPTLRRDGIIIWV